MLAVVPARRSSGRFRAVRVASRTVTFCSHTPFCSRATFRSRAVSLAFSVSLACHATSGWSAPHTFNRIVQQLHSRAVPLALSVSLARHATSGRCPPRTFNRTVQQSRTSGRCPPHASTSPPRPSRAAYRQNPTVGAVAMRFSVPKLFTLRYITCCLLLSRQLRQNVHRRPRPSICRRARIYWPRDMERGEVDGKSTAENTVSRG